MFKFTFPVYIPSMKINRFFREVKMSEYSDFIRTLLNAGRDNIDLLNTYIDQFIESTTCDGIEVWKLNIIDKINILLTIRMVSVGDSYKFSLSKDSENFNVEIRLSGILETIGKLPDDFSDLLKCKLSDSIDVHFSVPRFFIRSRTYSDIIDSCIVFDDDTESSITCISDRKAVVDCMPVEFTSNILEFIKAKEDICSKIKILNITGVISDDKDDDKVIYMSILNGTLLDLIFTIFTADTRTTYDLAYNLIKHGGFSSDLVNIYTVAEAGIFKNRLEAEVKASQQREKHESGPNIGGQPETM